MTANMCGQRQLNNKAVGSRTQRLNAAQVIMGLSNDNKAAARRHLAATYQQRGGYKQAEQVLLLGIQECQSILEKHHTDILDMRNMLAVIIRYQQKREMKIANTPFGPG
ncbi:hypothetical protein BJY01DRAFT_256507 [Aspergillus pseudoustus]|uniref:Uncharacterized protein n=1 Tax=Aspergillus pseudoustus TaxID=1810923 RepID=A0ABR4I8W1_9EURO